MIGWMEWSAPTVIIASCSLILATAGYMAKLVHAFRAHVEKQALLTGAVNGFADVVKMFRDDMGELRVEVKDLQATLKNGINSKIQDLQHAIEIQHANCCGHRSRFESELSRINQELEHINRMLSR